MSDKTWPISLVIFPNGRLGDSTAFNAILRVQSNLVWVSDLHSVCHSNHCFRVSFYARCPLFDKKFPITETGCALCEVLAVLEETVQHRACGRVSRFSWCKNKAPSDDRVRDKTRECYDEASHDKHKRIYAPGTNYNNYTITYGAARCRQQRLCVLPCCTQTVISH